MTSDSVQAEGGRLDLFLLPDAGVRGAHVRLDAAWREIARHDRALPAVRELLGQAVAASALLTAHTKVDGRLSVQLRGGGALRSLFAECTAAHTVRGLARLDADAGEHAASVEARDLRRLGAGALMAITIENPTPSGEPMRYQGLVPLESADLAGAFEDYFRQSEQLPTRLLLSADEESARGLLLQKLPGDAGADADGWNRIGQLFATLDTAELQAVEGPALLHRLFHQEGLQMLSQRDLRFGCSCSRGRVEDVLRSLGADEAYAAAEAGVDGAAEVVCEFCGHRYTFTRPQIATLLDGQTANTEPPARLQ